MHFRRVPDHLSRDLQCIEALDETLRRVGEKKEGQKYGLFIRVIRALDIKTHI